MLENGQRWLGWVLRNRLCKQAEGCLPAAARRAAPSSGVRCSWAPVCTSVSTRDALTLPSARRRRSSTASTVLQAGRRGGQVGGVRAAAAAAATRWAF